MLDISIHGILIYADLNFSQSTDSFNNTTLTVNTVFVDVSASDIKQGHHSRPILPILSVEGQNKNLLR